MPVPNEPSSLSMGPVHSGSRPSMRPSLSSSRPLEHAQPAAPHTLVAPAEEPAAPLVPFVPPTEIVPPDEAPDEAPEAPPEPLEDEPPLDAPPGVSSSPVFFPSLMP